VPPGRIAERHRGALEACRGHLARHRALEDEVVEPGFVARSGPVAVEIGRPDGLVRFLRVLGLGLIDARLLGQIVPVEPLGDGAPRG
jgi:hypothetical protein